MAGSARRCVGGGEAGGVNPFPLAKCPDSGYGEGAFFRVVGKHAAALNPVASGLARTSVRWSQAVGQTRVSKSIPSADVAGVLRSASCCWRCICAKTNISAQQVDDALARLRRDIAVHLSLAPCQGCGRDTLLYTIA